ncbi:helix-turn-helix domain-containing protein [Comamonas thiooxydans]|uniref:helix-turn-helix domain-containing protein n=1 Tax=Comamonas thiooxydans TaxID=363952 RepID=UPI001CCEAB80|nr:helix-turn-helix domain-containing protein [Comamonas thiooxydans]UBQ43925.1 helix-turn-helix domain-containing protein [Comamonas thiooxydans]
MDMRYATTAVDTPRRFEYWNDVVCRHCIPASSHRLTAGPFDAQLASRSLGAVAINTMAAPRHRWTRAAHHLRTAADDDLWLAYMHYGDGGVCQDGREAPLRCGDMVLYDAARPFEFTLSSQAIYLVRLPRQALLQRSTRAEQWIAHVFDSAKVGGDPLRSLILQAAMTDFANVSPDTAHRVGDTLLDLVGVALDFQSGSDVPLPERNLYARLISYIHREFRDPDLDVIALATAHHVSMRTVARAFARHGQSAMALVWRLRLDASYRELAEGRALSVKEVALDHGFSDLSHFSRSFRDRFGHAPTQVLRSRRA